MTAIRGIRRLRSHPRRKTDLIARFSEPKQEGPQGGWRLDHAPHEPGPSRRCATRRHRRCSLLRPTQTPPASSPCRRCWLGPAHRPRPKCRSTSSGRPRCRPSVAGRISPALATRRWSSKAIWMRSAWSSASIFCVLLAWGRFGVTKAIIPDGQEHFLTPSARRHTHLFGGLGLTVGERDEVYGGVTGPVQNQKQRTGIG